MNKDLTTSAVARQNVLNNPYALSQLEMHLALGGLQSVFVTNAYVYYDGPEMKADAYSHVRRGAGRISGNSRCFFACLSIRVVNGFLVQAAQILKTRLIKQQVILCRRHRCRRHS